MYCLDEPEAALSFTAQVGLVTAPDELAAHGSEVVCATHSPLLAALPGATLLELGDHGLRQVAWEELELVAHRRRHLDEPCATWPHPDPDRP